MIDRGRGQSSVVRGDSGGHIAGNPHVVLVGKRDTFQDVDEALGTGHGRRPEQERRPREFVENWLEQSTSCGGRAIFALKCAEKDRRCCDSLHIQSGADECQCFAAGGSRAECGPPTRPPQAPASRRAAGRLRRTAFVCFMLGVPAGASPAARAEAVCARRASRSLARSASGGW